MFVANREAIAQVEFDPIVHPQFDEKGNPLYRGDGSGVDYSTVKPVI